MVEKVKDGTLALDILLERRVPLVDHQDRARTQLPLCAYILILANLYILINDEKDTLYIICGSDCVHLM